MKTIEDIKQNGIELNTVYNGDCLDVLKEMPDNSIDTIITDPPYGLSEHKPEKIVVVLKEWLSGNDSLVPDGKGFMGKKWDAFVPPPAVWKECHRVLKPGATMLVFAATRSVDLMMISIRLSGFEIKNTIEWIYGEGFPKSLNIANVIAKREGATREGAASRGNTFLLNSEYREYNLTNNAKIWEGYGTALKPAHEPIVMAMKPNEGSYAENALKWGVAGLNIDGSRIKSVDWQPNRVLKKYTGNNKGNNSATNNFGVKEIKCINPVSTIKGRFPANIILDNSKEVEECFPETKPSRRSKRGTQSKVYSAGIEWERAREDTNTIRWHDDNGGSASRFFYKAEWTDEDLKSIYYCAKASKSERDSGLQNAPNVQGETYNFRQDGSFDGKIPIKRNFHPTVKPLKLMEYLCNLTKTPTGGIVLDPFAGSGTTGVACKKTSRQYILIEREQAYCEIIEHRLAAVKETLL